MDDGLSDKNPGTSAQLNLPSLTDFSSSVCFKGTFDVEAVLLHKTGRSFIAHIYWLPEGANSLI